MPRKVARKRKSRKPGRIDTAEKQRGANNPRQHTKEEVLKKERSIRKVNTSFQVDWMIH